MVVLKSKAVRVFDENNEDRWIVINYSPSNMPALPGTGNGTARYPMFISRTVYEHDCRVDKDELIAYLYDDEIKELYSDPENMWVQLTNWGE